MSLMVKMTINLLWDVDGWMSKGKRWVGTAEGKQRSCTDGAVPETLTVGPKIWRIFEKRGEKIFIVGCSVNTGRAQQAAGGEEQRECALNN